MVEFVVTVPRYLPHSGDLFLTGEGPALGYWRADAVRLEPWGDGTYRTQLALPRGPVRVLVTQGTWRKVENDGHGQERPARRIDVTGSTVLGMRVLGWSRRPLRDHHDFTSQHVTHSRMVSVYLPPGYDLQPERRYPVLYLQDGQNLFDAQIAFGGVPWGCDEVAERTIRNGHSQPVIIVGVANTPDRIHEYGPGSSIDHSWNYGQLLVEDIKPFIDQHYRTLKGPEQTGVGGSSMGGLISLYLCMWYPQVFGRCAAMSPSLWWERSALIRELEGEPESLKHCRIWLDMGGREGANEDSMRGNVHGAEALSRVLTHRQYDDHRYAYYPEAGHNESAWGARFGEVLSFLFPGQ